MKLKDVKEVGFYKITGDDDLWEAFPNTDKDREWVEKYPLLLDYWIYSHTDTDNRKVYNVDGLLYRIGYDYPDCEVEKTKQKYERVKDGLIREDNPTWQEKYIKLEQEFKEWREANRATGICETCTAKALIENDELRANVEKQRKEISKLKSIINRIKGEIREANC